jgi:sugar transferase (PEP-CTERM/EpsH1 system associated)
MAQYLIDRKKPAHVVMDFVDVDSQKWMDYARTRPWPLSSIYRHEGRALLAFERKVAQFASANIFVSEPERDLFRTLAPEAEAKTFAIGNGIDTSYFSPERDYAPPFEIAIPTLVFTGAMDYWPNIEAVKWFVTDILPRLRQTIPNAQFMIVGSNPTPDVAACGRMSGVTVTGRVPDVRPYLAHAWAVVAPLLSARGVQNKVLEGMSMARPVVATSQALEGIDATPGRHLIVADGADEFADATARAITAPASAGMGTSARLQICRRYSWAPQLARIRSLVGQDELFDVA